MRSTRPRWWRPTPGWVPVSPALGPPLFLLLFLRFRGPHQALRQDPFQDDLHVHCTPSIVVAKPSTVELVLVGCEPLPFQLSHPSEPFSLPRSQAAILPASEPRPPERLHRPTSSSYVTVRRKRKS